MPCPHYRIKISARSKSPPATAQAAYQSGERLYDERTHRTKCYTEKRGVVFTEIMLPDNAPKEYADRNTLWNAVEKAETSWNAQTARRIEIALPKELPLESSIGMIRENCREQFVSRGMIADIAIHDPDPPNHNPHAHVMLTMRAMDEQGRWLPKCRREYELDAEGKRIRDGNGKWKFRKVFTTDWDDRGNAEKWRQAWEKIQNRYMEEAGRSERVSMKSYDRQGVEQIPTVHMGPSVTAMERRGIRTDIGNLNREIKRVNALIASIRRGIARIREWLAGMKEAVSELEMEPKEVTLADILTERFAEWNNSSKDPVRFAELTAHLKDAGIVSVADLDRRTGEVGEAGGAVWERIKSVRRKIRDLEKLIRIAERKEQLDPVHDQYLQIHWKKRREKFAEKNRAELEEWNKIDRLVRKNLPDRPFGTDVLQKELDSLNAQMGDLSEDLFPYQKEMLVLRDLRKYVKKLIPELEPEREKMTPASREARKTSVTKRVTESRERYRDDDAEYVTETRERYRDDDMER